MSRPPPGARADYRIFLPITTRWGDNDVFGHVNNAVYYTYIDTAITTALVRHGILTRERGTHMVMVAEGGCRHHSEIAFPDPMVAGLRVARLGERSIRFEVGIFRGEEGLASAEGFLVHVCVDAATRRPAPLPDPWRRALTPYLTES